jgi:3-oxoadipate enol-lactonase
VMKIMFGRAFLRDRARAGLRAEQEAQLASLPPDRMQAALDSVVKRHAVASGLGAIKTPTLVLHGEDDRAIVLPRAHKMAVAIPGAQLVIVPRAGHTSTVEEPEAISRELRRFVEVH